MKNKIMKIMGVCLSVAVLATIAITGIPVNAIPAVDSPWTKTSIPSFDNNVLANNDWIGPFAMAKDGSAIYAATDAGLGVFTGARQVGSQVGFIGNTAPIMKSTDGGHTWAPLSGISVGEPFVPPPPTTSTSPPPDADSTPVAARHVSATITGPGIFDVVCSTLDPKIVYFTDGISVFKSVDGGLTWITIASLFTALGLTPGLLDDGYICSIDVGYIGSDPYIFAAVSTFGNQAGGAYVCKEAVYGSPWNNLNITSDRVVPWTSGADVYKVKVDPAFASTQMVMAVAAAYGAGPDAVRISTKYAGSQWAAGVADAVINSGQPAELLSASLFLPSDFSSNVNSGLMQLFAGIDPQNPNADLGDVFQIFFAPSSSSSAAFPMQLNNGNGFAVTSLAGSGTAANCKLLASGYLPSATDVPAVFSTKDAGQNWTLNAKRPSGGVSSFYSFLPTLQDVAVSYLLVMPDYFTSGKAFIGTAETPGPCNGISVTVDFGNTWNGFSLLNYFIDNIDDLAWMGGKLFMATQGPTPAVWRYDGTYWERVLVGSIEPGLGSQLALRVSPAGDAIFVLNVGGNDIWRSLDNGQTWKKLLSMTPDAIHSAVATGPSGLLVGSVDNVYQTTTNGVVWFARSCAIGNITDLKVASNGDVLAAGVDGAGVAKIARSTDGGTTFTVVTTPVYTSGTNAAFVAPTQDYATSGKVFVTGHSIIDKGIWTWTFGSSAAWKRVDLSGAQVDQGYGMVTAPGGPGSADEGTGMVYATDNTGPSEVVRVRGKMTVGESLPAPSGVSFTGLWYAPGSVKLWTIGSDQNIYTYTDTLNVAGSGVTVSAVTAHSAKVSWNALPGATEYAVFVNIAPQTVLYTAVNSPTIVVTHAAGATSATLSNLLSVTTYYVSVWATAPVSSFLFGGAPSVVTNPDVPSAPVGLVPAPGAQNVQPLVNFQWAAVSGATSYELWLDTKLDFSTAQKYTGIPAPAGNNAGDFSAPAALAYNTLYYWQVRAVTATGVSTWNGVWSFTTMPAPQAPVTVLPVPTPTIVVTVPPQVTVTVAAPVPTPTYVLPEPTVTIAGPDEQTPSYIWIIVAAGAVLTLAVIVLIIRTRRVV